MRDKKRRLEFYSYYDYTGISEHLEKMAKKGWMIESMSNFGWVYRRIEPQNLKFSVSYFSKASEFDPEPSDKQKEFIDYCEHTGWKFACSSAQLQVFYNEDENATPIETDYELEFETINKSIKKSVLPSYILLIGVFLLKIIYDINNAIDNPINYFSHYMNIFSTLCMIFAIVHIVIDITNYYIWYSKVKKICKYNSSIKSANTVLFNRIISYAILSLFGVFLILGLLYASAIERLSYILIIFFTAILFVIVTGIKKFLKKKKVCKQVNFTITMVACTLLYLGIIVGTVFISIILIKNGFFDDKKVTKYEYNGHTYSAYNHELPLTIEDFTGEIYDGYSKELLEDKTFILEYIVAYQTPRVDERYSEDMHNLDYEIVNVKCDFIYNMCKNNLIKDNEKHHFFEQEYIKDNAEAWGANEVYRLYDKQDGYYDDYIVCYDNIILHIDYSGEFTDDYKKIIGEIILKKIA